MTPPKKWYLHFPDSDASTDVGAGRNLVLFNSEGLMRKKNAREPLGHVKEVCHPSNTKCTEDYVMFHCEKGRIILSTKTYQWSKSVITETCSSVDSFITVVNNFINGTIETSDPSTQPSTISQPLLPQASSPTTSQTTPSQSPIHCQLLPQASSPTTSQSVLSQSPIHHQSLPPAPSPTTSQGLQSPIQDQSHTPTPLPSTQCSIQHQTTPVQQASITKRRSRILDSTQSLVKRLKCFDNNIDEEIERHRKGLFDIPVTQLMVPPRESRLLRGTDSVFVEKLKEKMLLDPSSPGATPMAVMCQDVMSIDQFNDKFANVYKYEVLGGLHTYTAKYELAEEYPETPFFCQALAEVYIGLSDEQALRLAQRHNQNSHFIHKITHRDLIEACRARLYKISGKDLDSETPAVTTEWKESCMKAIIPKGVSATQLDAIIYQSSLPKPVWDVAVDIMNMYESVKLKDQKPQCGLKTAKPEFKQMYFAPIRCLSLTDQCNLLLKCKNKEISLAEMKKEAEVLKKLEKLKKSFVKLTTAKSWEDAEDRFQPFASELELKKFTTLEIGKEIPQSFINFCRRALASKETSSSSSIEDQITKHGELVAVTIQGSLNSINGETIKASFANFQGADLILMSVPEGSSIEDVQCLGYTAKEINLFAGLYTYAAIALCYPTSLHEVSTAWSRLFGNTDTLFTISKDFHKPGESKKLDCYVMVAVLGYQSIDGLTKSTHFIYGEEELKANYVKGSREHISVHLIQHFCSPGGTILDITNDPKGTMSLVALEQRRNVIGVLENEEHRSTLFQCLQEKYTAAD